MDAKSHGLHLQFKSCVIAELKRLQRTSFPRYVSGFSQLRPLHISLSLFDLHLILVNQVHVGDISTTIRQIV